MSHLRRSRRKHYIKISSQMLNNKSKIRRQVSSNILPIHFLLTVPRQIRGSALMAFRQALAFPVCHMARHLLVGDTHLQAKAFHKPHLVNFSRRKCQLELAAHSKIIKYLQQGQLLHLRRQGKRQA